MNPYEAVAWGCLGGILPDTLRLVTLRHGEVPQYLRQGFFWLSLLLLVAVAGLAAYLLSPQRVIDAIALGFSAPEILSSSLGSKIPRYVGRRRTKGRSVQAARGSVAAGGDIREIAVNYSGYSGDKLAEDRGVPKDDREAAATGQTNLGVLYAEGRGGLPKDDREAACLFKLAAEQGNATGRANLGVFYERGRGGLPKDEREAARLFKLAAEQGNATGQANLGVFYERGRGGLAKDEREAARLYKLAADQGDATGQAHLGLFYEDGRGGLAKDERKAARLLKLAAAQGNDDEPQILTQLRHWWAN